MKIKLSVTATKIKNILKNHRNGVSLKELCKKVDITPNNMYPFFRELEESGIPLEKETVKGQAHYKIGSLPQNTSVGTYIIKKYHMDSDRNFIISNSSSAPLPTRHFIEASGKKITRHHFTVNSNPIDLIYEIDTPTYKEYTFCIPPDSTFTINDKYTLTAKNPIEYWYAEPKRDFDKYERHFIFEDKLDEAHPPTYSMTTSDGKHTTQKPLIMKTPRHYVFSQTKIHAHARVDFYWQWAVKKP